MKVKRLLELTERFINIGIPILVILLAGIIVLDFTHGLHKYEPYVTYFDYFIVAFFTIDLVFKWNKTRDVRRFLRLYWIDVLAVFPFYLVFRVYAFSRELLKIGEEVSEAQKIAHEAVLLREAKVAREARLVTEEARVLKEVSPAIRLLRFFQRTLRLFKGRFLLTHELLNEKQHSKT